MLRNSDTIIYNLKISLSQHYHELLRALSIVVFLTCNI